MRRIHSQETPQALLDLRMEPKPLITASRGIACMSPWHRARMLLDSDLIKYMTTRPSMSARFFSISSCIGAFRSSATARISFSFAAPYFSTNRSMWVSIVLAMSGI